MANIALVDDDNLVVQLLTAYLKEQDFTIQLTAKSGNEFLAKLEKEKVCPDLVLLDLRMKDGDGTETLDTLHFEYPELKIIILSSYYQDSSIGYLLKTGAHAFLSKEVEKEELPKIINEVLQKGHYFSSDQVEVMRNQVSSKVKKPILNDKNALSEREIEVLELICKQKTTKEIADRLFITAKTVEAHRSNLLVKTGVKNTAGLVVFAVQQGGLVSDV